MINEKHVKTYCKEYWKIENYDKAISDNTQTWICHHRNEQYYKRVDLIKLSLYYDCPPCELIFLTKEEHYKAHKYCAEKNDFKEKVSKRTKGRKLSEETKSKISKSSKGKHPKNLNDVWKRKISISVKGRHWYNNGEKCVFVVEQPEGFVPGRLSWK